MGAKERKMGDKGKERWERVRDVSDKGREREMKTWGVGWKCEKEGVKRFPFPFCFQTSSASIAGLQGLWCLYHATIFFTLLSEL